MPRFSINASMMLHEHDFLDRFQAAADLGFAGVDIQFPYEHPAGVVAQRLAQAGVEPVLINLPAGDLTTGGDGLACVPGREDAFGQAIEKARGYAQALGAKRVNVLTGKVPAGETEARCRAVLVDNLKRAADAFAGIGVTVMMEPCNRTDVPAYLIDRTDEALAVLADTGRENVGLQFDFYHRQMTEGAPLEGFSAALPRIAHVQFADVPGRHEPGTGSMDYEAIFRAIDASGYDGWVAAEYRPSKATADTLDWFRQAASA